MRSSLFDARAVAVVDLGFGDAGKGLVVDALVRELGAKLVVRFNGGAQAGHNVITSDGRHHTFSQLGAGSFVDDVRTHLSRHVVVHPTAALVEAEHAASVGIRDPLSRLSASPDALVVTPFHQAMSRLRELARGDARHGSCGVGVGEVMRHAIAFPEGALRVHHMSDVTTARRLVLHSRDRLGAELEMFSPTALAKNELRIFEEPELIDIWLKKAQFFHSRISIETDERTLRSTPEKIIFEGAQGMLLDERYGFHPFTTWSNCSFEHAAALAVSAGASLHRLGVARTYAHRHGPGPLPTESDEVARIAPEPHNPRGDWQGKFRRGWTDLVLARYARRVVGELDGIALTHLDAIANSDRWKICRSYEKLGADLAPGENLAAQETLTRALEKAKPIFEDLSGSKKDRERTCVDALENAFSAKAVIESSGSAPQNLRVIQLPR